MVEDFSTQFSSLYLPMKYLVIISKHSIYISDHSPFLSSQDKDQSKICSDQSCGFKKIYLLISLTLGGFTKIRSRSDRFF